MKDILITSSVLILALLVIRQVFKKALSRRVQYALWALVLVRLLVPVSLPAMDFSVLTAAQPVEQTVAQQANRVIYYGHQEQVPAAELEQRNIDPNNLPTLQDQYVFVESKGPGTSADGFLVHDPETNTVTRYSHMTVGPWKWMAQVWKVGMAVMGSFFLLSNLIFYLRLRKNRTEWTPTVGRKVYLVPEGVLPSPCLFGNAIYLTPAALRSEESLRHVLTHEETHARHLDPLWSFLRCVCLTVYWFDPLVWAAAACAKTDCELACDEAVLAKLGEGERIPYGQTLLSLIPVKRVANPLLTATTMTAGKRQLKDRITRIAQNPRQLAAAVAAVAVLALLISACTFAGGESAQDPDPSPMPTENQEVTPTESQEPTPSTPPMFVEGHGPESRSLTEEELQWFNEEFFNGLDERGYYYNLRNQFVSLLNLYDRPEDIDLFELFYCDGVELTQEEYLTLGIENPLCPWFKLTPEYIDDVLTRYIGLTLEQTNQVNFAFTYNEPLGAYVWEHGDTNYPGNIEFISGTREGNTVKLYHSGWSYGTRMFCTTLTEQPDGSYRFVSNEKFQGAYVLVDIRDIPDHMITWSGVPAEVEAAVRECAERVYKASKTPTAPEPAGEAYAWGDPVAWDDWRVLTFEGPYLYTFGDVTVEAWRFLQQLHTSQKDVDYIPEDGWYSNISSRNMVFFQKGADGSLTFLGSDWSSWEDSMASSTITEKISQRLEELGLVSNFANSSILEYGFELVGVPGDDMYHVLADDHGNTSFELTAGTFVTLRGTWSPTSADLQVRLELEDGSPVTEAALANSNMLTASVSTTGRYQLKVATGPDGIDNGTLTLLGTSNNTIAIRVGDMVYEWGLGTMLTKADGTVWAWGSNTYGQLGDGTLPEWETPIPSPSSAIDETLTKVYAGLGVSNHLDVAYYWYDSQRMIAFFVPDLDFELPETESSFTLSGLSSEQTYQVLTGYSGETAFDWTAGTTVTFLGSWFPQSEGLQLRLELEDGSDAVEETLIPDDFLVMTVPVTGRYQVKVAPDPDEINGGALLLFPGDWHDWPKKD